VAWPAGSATSQPRTSTAAGGRPGRRLSHSLRRQLHPTEAIHTCALSVGSPASSACCCSHMPSSHASISSQQQQPAPAAACLLLLLHRSAPPGRQQPAGSNSGAVLAASSCAGTSMQQTAGRRALLLRSSAQAGSLPAAVSLAFASGCTGDVQPLSLQASTRPVPRPHPRRCCTRWRRQCGPARPRGHSPRHTATCLCTSCARRAL
jgi:hypothetical protein